MVYWLDSFAHSFSHFVELVAKVKTYGIFQLKFLFQFILNFFFVEAQRTFLYTNSYLELRNIPLSTLPWTSNKLLYSFQLPA